MSPTDNVTPIHRARGIASTKAVDLGAPTRAALCAIAWGSATAIVTDRPRALLDMSDPTATILGGINWTAAPPVAVSTSKERTVEGFFESFDW